jgi:hypothetical protein
MEPDGQLGKDYVDMDQQQMQNINQAAEQLTDSARHSFQVLAERTVALQDSNLRLTQSFFQNFMEQLQSQTQGNRDAAQNLQEQGLRQQEALETLRQEATNAYSEFLNAALSFYQEALRTATEVAEGNVQNVAQAAQQSSEAASDAMQSTVQATSRVAQQSTEAATRNG